MSFPGRAVLVAVAVAATLVSISGCASAADDDADSPGDNEGAASAVSSDPTYNAWTKIVRDAGGEVHPNGWATVLGIRGLSSEGAKHETSSHRAFDDLVVVLERNGKVHRFAASTHPWELHGVHGVPDVDGDGQSDVGMIRPGLYTAKGRGSDRQVGGLPAFDVKAGSGSGSGSGTGSGLLPGWRDINHDGRFAASERARSESRNETLSAVLFHRGGDGAPAAVGCQVFDRDDMIELISVVGGSSASFNYVLVDAESLDVSALPR